MVNEWAKQPARAFSAGAFRHGLIESAEANMCIGIFAAPGRTYSAALALADELSGYGARVLIVSNGVARTSAQGWDNKFECDEFLSPILDTIPAQLFAEALARELGVAPGFRYIGKVINKL
jgi:fructoselysine-6-P-deglycase FrlB-like protein